ncbi:hypothetical protein KKI17_01055 [Patescibacteria group bacterium]|nr:hypothetical protein [Patescibacteria group bacterium]
MVAKREQASNGRGPSFSRIAMSILFLLMVGGIMTVLVVRNVRMAQKRAELGETIAALQEQATGLEERKGELEQGLVAQGTEEYQERVLRERGLYQKPGETAVTVVRAQEEGESEEKQERVWLAPLEILKRIFSRE